MLAGPMAVVAVAVGFAAQGLAPRPYGAAQGELLDALIDTPPPAQDTTTAAEQLRRLEARRLFWHNDLSYWMPNGNSHYAGVGSDQISP